LPSQALLRSHLKLLLTQRLLPLTVRPRKHPRAQRRRLSRRRRASAVPPKRLRAPTPPNKEAPINLSARPLEMVPSANPLLSSSKEYSLVEVFSCPATSSGRFLSGKTPLPSRASLSGSVRIIPLSRIPSQPLRRCQSAMPLLQGEREFPRRPLFSAARGYPQRIAFSGHGPWV
jgi:hypothetical protein